MIHLDSLVVEALDGEVAGVSGHRQVVGGYETLWDYRIRREGIRDLESHYLDTSKDFCEAHPNHMWVSLTELIGLLRGSC